MHLQMAQTTMLKYTSNNPLKRRCAAAQHPEAAARYIKGFPARGWVIQSGTVSPTTSTAPLSPTASEAATTDSEMDDSDMGDVAMRTSSTSYEEEAGTCREDVHEVRASRGDIARKGFMIAAVVPKLLVRHRVFKGGLEVSIEEEVTAC